MSDTLGLSRTVHAPLSATDLQSLGKRASNEYLCRGSSLNDAIVKIAKEYPTISAHQVKRVVEFANQETFSSMFEKQAGDKNIEFEIADPGVVLHELDNGARPSMQIISDDYACGPVKTAGAETGGDVELMRMFGFEPYTPELEKSAEKLVMGVDLSAGPDMSSVFRILEGGQVEQVKEGSAVDRILQAAREDGTVEPGTEGLDNNPKLEGSQETYDEAATHEKVSMGGMVPQGSIGAGPAMTGSQMDPAEQHHQEMMEMSRQVELEKKKQELANIRQKTEQMMNPQPDPAMDPAAAQGQGEAQAAGGAQPPPDVAAAIQGGMPGGGGGGEIMPQQKMAAELVSKAVQYVQAARPEMRKVAANIKLGTSLGKIKEAVANKETPYPQANPFGDLQRTKWQLDKLAEDSDHACAKNRDLLKEAQAEFHGHVFQLLSNGYNLGGVAQSMSAITEDENFLKSAMSDMVSYLAGKDIDTRKLQSDVIQYEMEKGASARVINPKHPLILTFDAMHKLAMGQRVLEHARNQIANHHREVVHTLQEAVRREPITL